MKKIMIIGLGEVGSTVLLEMNDIIQARNLPYQVMGMEINDEKIAKYRKMGFSIFTPADKIPDCDGYLICLFTFQQIVDAVFSILNRKEVINYFISIESTIDPNSWQILSDMLEYDEIRNLVVVPHRLVYNDPKYGAFNLDRNMGIFDIKDPPQQAFDFYHDFMSGKLSIADHKHVILSKVVENSLRMSQIVYAQELKRACEVNHYDFNVIRGLVNNKWNTFLMEAREGVDANGTGHCLVKDNRFLADHLPESALLRQLDALNELYIKEYAAKATN